MTEVGGDKESLEELVENIRDAPILFKHLGPLGEIIDQEMSRTYPMTDWAWGIEMCPMSYQVA